MTMQYGDTAAVVAGDSSNPGVKCEIWVNGILRTSSVASYRTDDMAVCGFVVGRNVVIHATE